MRRLITFSKHTLANHFLPAIVNDDYTGLDDGDHEQLDRFLAEIRSEVATLCDELAPDMYFYDIIFGDVQDDFRRCDVTGLQALCSPATVMVTTYGGVAPDADLYKIL